MYGVAWPTIAMAILNVLFLWIQVLSLPGTRRAVPRHLHFILGIMVVEIVMPLFLGFAFLQIHGDFGPILTILCYIMWVVGACMVSSNSEWMSGLFGLRNSVLKYCEDRQIHLDRIDSWRKDHRMKYGNLETQVP